MPAPLRHSYPPIRVGVKGFPQKSDGSTATVTSIPAMPGDGDLPPAATAITAALRDPGRTVSPVLCPKSRATAPPAARR